MRFKLLLLSILLISGCGQSNSLFLGNGVFKEIIDTDGKEIVVDMKKIQPIIIDEDEFFQSQFKDLFVNIDLYNQLSRQGIKMNIKGDVVSGLDKEIKRVMKGKQIQIKVLKNGVETAENKTF